MATSSADIEGLQRAAEALSREGTAVADLGGHAAGIRAANPPRTSASLAALGHEWSAGLGKAGSEVRILAGVAALTASLFARADHG
jgi:hypothetical protein